jgi:tRNA (guanine-N7-)-methyltransferase
MKMMPLRRQALLRNVEPSPPNWEIAFSRAAPLEVDLGCGRGQYVWERALFCPGVNIVALDSRRKWIDALRARCRTKGVTNLRAIRCDVSEDLPILFAAGSVNAFTIHHPDPWWKKRHRKRRLIHPAFVDLIQRLLKPQGWIFLQSDVPDLISESQAIFREYGAFRSVDGDLVKREWMGGIKSHREARCLQQGIPIQRIAYVRTGE